MALNWCKCSACFLCCCYCFHVVGREDNSFQVYFSKLTIKLHKVVPSPRCPDVILACVSERSVTKLISNSPYKMIKEQQRIAEKYMYIDQLHIKINTPSRRSSVPFWGKRISAQPLLNALVIRCIWAPRFVPRHEQILHAADSCSRVSGMNSTTPATLNMNPKQNI